MKQQPLFGAGPESAKKTTAEEGVPRLRVAQRQQLRLQVVDVDTLIPEDHAARLIASAVERLDLSRFYERIRARGEAAGRPATDPKLLVSLWLYATVDGIGSARELERLTREHAAYRWLCGGVTVNHHLLAKFRVGYEQALDDLLCDVISKLMAAGLITLRYVAHDGMRVRASAGASSFRGRDRLTELSKEARAHVGTLKKSVHDPGHRTRREAAQLRAAQDRDERVKRALDAMTDAEQTKARQSRKKDRKKKPRVSTTDPEARVMKMADGGFRPAYNLQFSTDVDSRFIVGVQVSTNGSDAALLTPAIEDIERRVGLLPEAMLVDGGFVNRPAFDRAAAQDIVIYAPVPTPRKPGIDPYERKPGDSEANAAWRERMQTPEAKELYKQRAATAETTNADLRTHRGLDRLLVRGSGKVLSVTLWAALAYNLLHAPLSALAG